MTIDRPQDTDFQQQMYSGKKKRHTASAMVLSDRSRYIYYLSDLYKGSYVDISILKLEFEVGKKWFTNKRLIVDLGFLGLDKLYDIAEFMIAHKRKPSKKGEPKRKFTPAQRAHNREVSRRRVYVENAIGEMKRYRVLINRSRIKCYDRKNRELKVCAGLSNYKIRLRA